MENIHYWGYRIDTNHIEFFWQELEQGRLRQGWGYDDSQNLKDFTAFNDSVARRNFSIFNQVKKNDILLIPRLPKWDYIAIVQASEDFDKGYSFKISNYGDYGHIFPAKFIKYFSRTNAQVDASVRTTLRNLSRFWNIDYLEESIDKLIKCKNNIESGAIVEDKMECLINDILNDPKLSKSLFEKFNNKFESKEWENVFIEGLKSLFPFYEIEHTGNRHEEQHGTDILIKIPSLSQDLSYAIAIQIKDYNGIVGIEPLQQLSNAEIWNKDESLKLIDKILILIGADNADNVNLIEKANQMGITIFMKDDVSDILYKMALKKAARGIK